MVSALRACGLLWRLIEQQKSVTTHKIFDEDFIIACILIHEIAENKYLHACYILSQIQYSTSIFPIQFNVSVPCFFVCCSCRHATMKSCFNRWSTVATIGWTKLCKDTKDFLWIYTFIPFCFNVKPTATENPHIFYLLSLNSWWWLRNKKKSRSQIHVHFFYNNKNTKTLLLFVYLFVTVNCIMSKYRSIIQ